MRPSWSSHGDRRITRRRPVIQWLPAIPQLMIAYALRSLRQMVLLISLFTLLFTERIPRPLFGMIATTYRMRGGRSPRVRAEPDPPPSQASAAGAR